MSEDRKGQLERELELRRHFMDRLPLCPDHRDKVAGEPCLKCQLERAVTAAARLRDALNQFKQREGLDGRPCFCLNDVKNVAWSSGHSRVCRTAREAIQTTEEPE